MFHKNHPLDPRRCTARTVPKVSGCDSELGNFISGLHRADGTGKEASRLLLREFGGYPARKSRHQAGTVHSGSHPTAGRLSGGFGWSYRYGGSGYSIASSAAALLAGKDDDARDVGRMFLAENGGCVYIDLDHLELCTPETVSAFDHVACWHAMLRLSYRALLAANRRQPDGRKIHVLVNNSDGRGNSYGSHLNFLVTEACRQNIFERKVHYMLYLAAYQVSSIIFTGQGKVGSEHEAPGVDFQLSQRADFCKQLSGPQTTFSRPIINSRDEAHCGTQSYFRSQAEKAATDMARVHVIFYDNTLCHVSTLLKVGVMQIVLAMIEAEFVNLNLVLEDPVRALIRWSHDPTLRAKSPLCSGRKLTATELQLLFFDEASRFVAAGRCDGIVPRAEEILDLWGDTLVKLEGRDMPVLSRRLDWALKQSLLERALREHPELNGDWAHPAIKRLDLVYSSIDPDEGLYWASENGDAVDRVVRGDDIERFEANPPEDTRAWTRAMLLRLAGKENVDSVDWDSIQVTTPRRDFRTVERSLELASPFAFTRSLSEPVFAGSRSLDSVITRLDRMAETFPQEEDTHNEHP